MFRDPIMAMGVKFRKVVHRGSRENSKKKCLTVAFPNDQTKEKKLLCYRAVQTLTIPLAISAL